MVLKFLPKLSKVFGPPPEWDPKANAQDSGLALITAIMIVGLMIIFTTDMIINSTVSLRLATTQRDRIKAEYLAKSGFNLGLLLLQADWAMDLAQSLMDPNSVPADSEGDPWAALNGIPIGGNTADLLSSATEGFNLSQVNDSGVMDQLKLFDGQFTVEINDEGGKINLNTCSSRSFECEKLLETLLFNCPIERRFLEKKKLSGKELRLNIGNWVKENNAAQAGGLIDEGRGYNSRKYKIKPKHAPFDSLEELRLVEGFDDEVYTVFSPYFTVFPIPDASFPKPVININTASRELLSCLIPESANASASKAIAFTSPAKDGSKQSVTSAKDIESLIRDTLGGKADLKDHFKFQSDTFKIKVKGESGPQTRELEAVVQRRFTKPEEQRERPLTSYRILYFKIL